ncbi:MAG: hypothetical protein AMXMBFR7_34720 [Planctomycetota bacterium]
MTEDERQKLAVLKSSIKLESDADWSDYMKVCTELPITPDPEVLASMLSILRDTPTGDPLWNLIEACERFPEDIYIKCLVKSASLIFKSAPEGLRLMLCTILNDEKQNYAILADAFDALDQENVAFFQRYSPELLKVSRKYESTLSKLFSRKINM